MSRFGGGSSRGRPHPRAGFQRPGQAAAEAAKGVSPALLKQAMRSGQLNLSSRELTKGSDLLIRMANMLHYWVIQLLPFYCSMSFFIIISIF